MALRTSINKSGKWNTPEAILLLAVVFELVGHLHGQLEYPPSGVKLIKNRVPFTISATYDKQTCKIGWAGIDTLNDTKIGDIRLRDNKRQLKNFKDDVVDRQNIYQKNIPYSQNKRWCWIMFEQFNQRILDFEFLFYKPYFGNNKTQSWWPRLFPEIHTGDDKDGGIVYSSKSVWQMIESMTITSEWDGSKETVAAPFPVFKCAFSGAWRMVDGDLSTVQDDWFIYEVVMHEVIRTQSKEYSVHDGQELTVKIKPGFSEVVNCEVHSTATVKYEWVWQIKTRQDTSFKNIQLSKFEVWPETTTRLYAKPERVWDDPRREEMENCRVQVTTGQVGFTMDKEAAGHDLDPFHYNGSQLRCLLVYEYDSGHKYTVRSYTMNLEYDWSVYAKDYLKPLDCDPYKTAFGMATFLTCFVYGLTCMVYRKKDAFHLEKWRHLRVPVVAPEHYHEMVRKYKKAMAKEKRFKTRYSKMALTRRKGVPVSTSDEADPQNKQTSGKKKWSGDLGGTLQLPTNKAPQNKNRSCYDPTEDPSGLWTPSHGAGGWAYKYSNQYYEDLRDCLSDQDQSYDDRSMISLSKRYRGYLEALRGAGDGGDGPSEQVPLQAERHSVYEEGIYDNGHNVLYEDVFGSSANEDSDRSGEDSNDSHDEPEEDTSEDDCDTSDGELADDSDDSSRDSDGNACPSQSGKVGHDSNCESETERSHRYVRKQYSIQDKKML